MAEVSLCSHGPCFCQGEFGADEREGSVFPSALVLRSSVLTFHMPLWLRCLLYTCLCLVLHSRYLGYLKSSPFSPCWWMLCFILSCTISSTSLASPSLVLKRANTLRGTDHPTPFHGQLEKVPAGSNAAFLGLERVFPAITVLHLPHALRYVGFTHTDGWTWAK